jgi:hypothetical protein
MNVSSDRVIRCESDVFTQNLNRLPYEFAHNLAGSPSCLSFPAWSIWRRRWRRATRRIWPAGDVYFNDGLIEAGEKPVRPGYAAHGCRRPDSPD